MKVILFLFAAMLMAAMVASCTKTSIDVSGNYICKQHYNAEMIDKLTLELDADGAIFLKSDLMSSKGSYEIIKDSLFVKTKLFDMKLKIKKDTLIGWNVLYVKRP